MNFKKSLILAIILFIFSSVLSMVLPISLNPIKSLNVIGFPLGFYAYQTEPWAGQTPYWQNTLFLSFFLIDSIFWYLISIAIILIYDKYKKI